MAAAAAAVGSSIVTARPAGADPVAPLYLPAPGGPSRLYDSRAGDGRIGKNQTRKVPVLEEPDPSIVAMCVNVTITGTLGSTGFLSLFPGDQSWPETSNINWFAPGQTLANNAFTGVAASDGSINVYCGTVTGGSTHFVIDLMAISILQDLAFLDGAAVQGARVPGRIGPLRQV